MNQKHRIFIAINLPEDIKDKLAKYQQKWPELENTVRWTKKDNIHITLIFLGYLSNEELVETCKIVKELAQKHSSFLIKLNKICYGPVGKFPPKMIWAVGDSFQELTSLYNDLSKLLQGSSLQRFSLHITLGRLRQFEWRKIEPEERPEINEDIALSFKVNSIEVMESELKRGGPRYTILESYSL